MPLALRSSSTLATSQTASSYTLAKPAGVAAGDLLLCSALACETAFGLAAPIATAGPAGFSDLLDDGAGFSGADARLQYQLDPGAGAARQYWWFGWKIADAGDETAASYTVAIAGDYGSAGMQAAMMAVSGAAAAPFVDRDSARNGAGTGGTELEVPDVVGSGGTVADLSFVSTLGVIGKNGVWVAVVEGSDGNERVYAAAAAINMSGSLIAGLGLSNLLTLYQDDAFCFATGADSIVGGDPPPPSPPGPGTVTVSIF